MKIIVDAMGGDNAPLAIVQGSILAAKAYGEHVVLVGDEAQILPILKQEGAEHMENLSVVHASDVVDMHDDPATVLRAKPNSSMAVALNLVKKGEGDAFVSAGSTGAVLSGATLYCKRIRGIRRGALAPMIPCASGNVLLVDCGANTECTPEYLLQFAFLGSFYMEHVHGYQAPRVGLVNNGAEDTKGDALRVQTYQLLKQAHEAGRINFVGNVEGRDVPLGTCDVAVCDGFAGNVLLKTVEGVAMFLGKEIKKVFLRNTATKLAYLACQKGMDEFKELFNQDTVGGAPMLGISKPVIKAHGSSNEIAFMNAIRQAVEFERSGVIAKIQENIEVMSVS